MFSARPRFSVRRLAAASAFSAIALMLSVYPAAAQTTVIGFGPGAIGAEDNATDTGASSYSLGFAFTANNASLITSLGYFNDPSFDPAHPFGSVVLNPKPTGTYSYTSSHDVGLYQVIPATSLAPETSLLLGSTTITSTSIADGDFLYNAITPIALVAGNQYVIAGVTGGTDPYVYAVQDSMGNDAKTVASPITYTQDRYAVSGTLAYPTITDGSSESGFFGPNFKITDTLPASAAPEPGQWSVLALAALGLGTLIVRVRRRAAAAE